MPATSEMFHLLNPANHSRTLADVERYRLEPHVVAGDVYTHPMHQGRAVGRITGSAGGCIVSASSTSSAAVDVVRSSRSTCVFLPAGQALRDVAHRHDDLPGLRSRIPQACVAVFAASPLTAAACRRHACRSWTTAAFTTLPSRWAAKTRPGRCRPCRQRVGETLTGALNESTVELCHSRGRATTGATTVLSKQ